MSLTKVKSGEARAKLRDLLDQVLAGKGDVIIERNGKEVAVMIPAADYEQIRERLENLRTIRETEAVYKTTKKQVTINAEERTATIPLDLYNNLVAEREARFEVIREMQDNAPDLSEEEVEAIVNAAIQKVRAESAKSSS